MISVHQRIIKEMIPTKRVDKLPSPSSQYFHNFTCSPTIYLCFTVEELALVDIVAVQDPEIQPRNHLIAKPP
jgi:hypothetical protein